MLVPSYHLVLHYFDGRPEGSFERRLALLPKRVSTDRGEGGARGSKYSDLIETKKTKQSTEVLTLFFFLDAVLISIYIKLGLHFSQCPSPTNGHTSSL